MALESIRQEPSFDAFVDAVERRNTLAHIKAKQQILTLLIS